MNMQNVMYYGAEAIDVVARCLALNHINITELADQELSRRRDRDKHMRRIRARA